MKMISYSSTKPHCLSYQISFSLQIWHICSALITALNMQHTPSSVHLIQLQQARKLNRWFISPGDWAIITEVASWGIIMHWYHAYYSAPKQCISHFIMSGKKVFHTTCTCRARSAYQGWWGLPVMVSHQRQVYLSTSRGSIHGMSMDIYLKSLT